MKEIGVSSAFGMMNTVGEDRRSRVTKNASDRKFCAFIIKKRSDSCAFGMINIVCFASGGAVGGPREDPLGDQKTCFFPCFLRKKAILGSGNQRGIPFGGQRE